MSKRPIRCAHDYLLDKEIYGKTVKEFRDYMHSHGHYYDLLIDEYGLYNNLDSSTKKNVDSSIPIEYGVVDETTIYIRLHKHQGEYQTMQRWVY